MLVERLGMGDIWMAADASVESGMLRRCCSTNLDFTDGG